MAGISPSSTPPTTRRRGYTNGSVFRRSARTLFIDETTTTAKARVDLPKMAIPIMRLKEEPEHGPQDAASKLPPIVLKEVYEQRFNREDQAGKEAIWRELGRFLQRYIKPDARVVDIACDLGYFIRNVHAQERWATD